MSSGLDRLLMGEGRNSSIFSDESVAVATVHAFNRFVQD